MNAKELATILFDRTPYGYAAKLAQRFGVVRWRVADWKHRGRIPQKHLATALEIVAEMKMQSCSRKELDTSSPPG